MQDAVAAFQIAPLWAQIAMVLFAAMAAIAVIQPTVRRRTFRRRFDAIAQSLGQRAPTTRELPFGFSVSIGGRPFEVRHDLRSTSRGGSYRGPSGFLLITATRLTSTRWAMHQVDIKKLGKIGSWLVSGKRLTGDAEFDARFVVIEDGLPARDGWLDAATRKAIARFFDEASAPGVLWLRDGELSFTMPDTWPPADGVAMRALLEHQNALAAALDRTAAPPGIHPR